jgi:hypothetical protein
MDEKDRLGNKLREAEKGREDQYFTQRDRELIAKLKSAKADEADAALTDAVRMRCPKCGNRLHQVTRHDVTADECRSCHGIWLDHNQLERLAEREREGWVVRWLRSITHL